MSEKNETLSKQFLLSNKEQENINENWFNKFFLKLSPYGNLLVIAGKRNLVICTGKLSSNEQINFTITSRIELTDNEKYFF